VRLLFAMTGAYLPQLVGGSEWSTHELSIGLVGRGNDVAVLCQLGRQRDWTHVKNRMVARATGRGYPCDRWGSYRTYRGCDPVNGVREVASTFRPDVAIVKGVDGGLVQAFLDQNIRTVLYFRDVEFGATGSSIPRHPKLRFLANSAFTATRAASTLGIDAPVVVQPIVSRNNYRTRNHGRYVLFVNPVAKKGVQIALDLARENPDIPFVFLESWPMDRQKVATLEKAIAPLGNVTFRRVTLRMADAYAHARILLVPSVWEEAWGRVVTEAQLSGIPVIASAIGGLPESVGPGGVLIPPGNAVDCWNAHLREMWHSDAVYRRYRELAIEHSRRPEIDTDRLLTRFLDAVSGW
jgi:glycosyltransferase involved in cell wall biosynthesis